MESGEEKANWHIRKEISVGHLGTTLMVIIAMVAGWYDIQNRLDRVEEHVIDPHPHATADQRLNQQELRLVATEATLGAVEKQVSGYQQELLRRMDRQDTTLARIEDRLDQHTVNDRQ
jgi:uncharacterized protein YabN with tetrapyrrole methylase and pyrophosphatase domain